MSTSLIFPPASSDVGWLDEYDTGKMGVPVDARDEWLIPVIGADVSSDDRQRLLTYSVFHNAAGSSTAEVAELIGKVDDLTEMLELYLDGLLAEEEEV